MFKVNYQGINEDNILNKNLFTFTHQIEIGMDSQGLLPNRRLVARDAYDSQATIYPWATKISNREREQVTSG